MPWRHADARGTLAADAIEGRNGRGVIAMSGIVEDPRAEGGSAPAGSRPPAPPPVAHDVFVSYSTRDKPVADALVARLEQEGIRCWVAPRDVLPGRLWGEAIVDAIRTSRVMVVVLSGEANHSPQVLREVERAVANDVVVIPFRIESIEPTGAMSYYLASEHWLDALTPPLDSHLQRLTEVTRALLVPGPPAPPPPGVPPPPAGQARRRPRWVVPGMIAVAGLALVVVGIVVLSRPAGPEPEPVAVEDLEPGMCLTAPADAGGDQAAYWATVDLWSAPVGVVPCDQPHGAEVYFVGDGWAADASYPGLDAVIDAWAVTCDEELLAGASGPASGRSFTGWFPMDETAWEAGDREVGCIAYSGAGEDLEGIADPGR
jgi:hypothetical protein